MIRLNVTAEGFSEEEFVSDILRPHLLRFNIYTDVRKVLTNRKLKKRGGVVGFQKFRNDVTQWIKEQPNAYHTTFIDLYGLTTDFPAYQALKEKSPYERVVGMEQELGKVIGHHRFIPYIQLHEYESLLFAEPGITENWLALYNQFPQGSFQKILDKCKGNPELINDHPDTAPSKRIISLVRGYDKVADGSLILQEIGLDTLRAHCAHFNDWVTGLERLNEYA